LTLIYVAKQVDWRLRLQLHVACHDVLLTVPLNDFAAYVTNYCIILTHYTLYTSLSYSYRSQYFLL